MPKPKPQPKPPAVVKSFATALATKTLATLPALTPAAREAFAQQTTPAERAQLGGQTKSAGVLRDAGAWLAVMTRALEKYGASIRYGEGRVAFFCEAILTLDEAMSSARGARTGALVSNARRNAAMRQARAVRDDLLPALAQVTRGTSVAAQIDDVERDLLHDDQLAIALGKLADVLEAELSRAAKDPKAKARLDGATLTAADLARARGVQAALGAAGLERAEAGRTQHNDPPEVNAAEGTLLAEMRVAKKAFDAAHAQLATVPRLVPGPATRAVLGDHRGKGKGRRAGKAAPPATTGAPGA